MKLASWNVNSLKVRLPQLLHYLETRQPDVVCLQETKLEDANFPRQELESAGYSVAFSGQKTYNGVALLSRNALGGLDDVTCGNPLFEDPQKRLIAATIDGIRVICSYIPNGQEVGSDKYAYKLAWLDALERWLGEELTRHPQLVLAGDFNIAPDDRDVYDPEAWAGKILCSAAERAAFLRLAQLGMHDSFRRFEQPEKSFSWWDYRMLGFPKNLGLRIDHILLSKPLAERCSAAGIDRDMRKLERPSDHAPVTATLDR